MVESYEVFLKESQLDTYIDVHSYHKNEGQLVLQIDSTYDTPERLKYFYSFWDGLEEHYDTMQLSFSGFFLYELHRITTQSIFSLSILIKSKHEKQPVVTIDPLKPLFAGYDPPEILTKKSFITSRGSNYDAKNVIEGITPKGVVPVNTTIQEAHSIMRRVVLNFLQENFSIDKSDIVIDNNDEFQETYIIDKKKILTDSYFERIEVHVDYRIISERETEINYTVNIFYARGILQRGEYEELELPANQRLQKIFQPFSRKVLYEARKG